MFVDLNSKAKESKKLQDANYGKIPLSGIFQISVKNIQFKMLTINSDDTSIVDRFWSDKFTDRVLEKWIEWTSEQGVYIDVGAHTGLFTIAALVSNKNNKLITLEPFSLNFNRIISNLRLNNFDNRNVALFNLAVSNDNKNVKFTVNTPWSYLSKGGKIGQNGIDIKAIKLDSLNFSGESIAIKGIKIDTEGEDLMVLYGAKNLIKKYMPKLIIEVRPNNIEEILCFLKNFEYKYIYDIYGNINVEELISNFNNKISKDIFCEI